MIIDKNKLLRRVQFGDPSLRAIARDLTKAEVLSTATTKLISDMRYTLKHKKYGVALAAPQVGKNIALCIIEIRPIKTRPNIPKEKWASLVLINPEIIKTYGKRQQLWEGCISFAEIFAKVPRYKKVNVKYQNQQGLSLQEDFEGLLAHVVQHEIDHLNGVLFVDKVKDPNSYMTASEYTKRIVKTGKNKEEL